MCVYSSKVHLLPFRTEKLSLLALMVLPIWGWESKSTPYQRQLPKTRYKTCFEVYKRKNPWSNKGTRVLSFIVTHLYWVLGFVAFIYDNSNYYQRMLIRIVRIILFDLMKECLLAFSTAYLSDLQIWLNFNNSLTPH